MDTPQPLEALPSSVGYRWHEFGGEDGSLLELIGRFWTHPPAESPGTEDE
jgi:hypothetical protein